LGHLRESARLTLKHQNFRASYHALYHACEAWKLLVPMLEAVQLGFRSRLGRAYFGRLFRHLQHLDTPVKEGDQISIVPAIAGG